MRILAIDPGPTESAYCVIEDGAPQFFGKISCEDALDRIETGLWDYCEHLAIEMVESFGMAVGAEVFETVFWSGRFVQAWFGKPWSRVYRKEVKMNLCKSMRAKDGNVRQAIIDRFGGTAAIGRKATPGPLYGISGDVWSALAVGLTFLDTQKAAVTA